MLFGSRSPCILQQLMTIFEVILFFFYFLLLYWCTANPSSPATLVAFRRVIFFVGFKFFLTNICALRQHPFVMQRAHIFLCFSAASSLWQESSFWSQMIAMSFTFTNIPMAIKFMIMVIGLAYKTTIKKYCEKRLRLEGSKSRRELMSGVSYSISSRSV